MLVHHTRSPMRPLSCAVACAMVLAGVMATDQAVAQERFAGNWVIVSAISAPWASDPKDRADEADARRLVGQRLTIGATIVHAPQPLGCSKPTYILEDATPDMMFEGSLNADGAGKAVDPVAAARALGVTQRSIRAMTASCSEVTFYLADPDTILFGLNNRVFTARRRK